VVGRADEGGAGCGRRRRAPNHPGGLRSRRHGLGGAARARYPPRVAARGNANTSDVTSRPGLRPA
jgi:hypothetical protein